MFFRRQVTPRLYNNKHVIDSNTYEQAQWKEFHVQSNSSTDVNKITLQWYSKT